MGPGFPRLQKLHDLTLNVQGLANKTVRITGIATPNPLRKFIRAYQDLGLLKNYLWSCQPQLEMSPKLKASKGGRIDGD